MKFPVIVIPAYQPQQVLVTLVQQLTEKCPFKIIIVNDGSDPNCLPIFQTLSQLPNVNVLNHAINRGKGQALKTAFDYFLTHYQQESVGVVTADADGQHAVEDIISLGYALQENPQTLCLGQRDFGDSVPWRSRFGNKLTRTIFKWFTGYEITDTQTGLRGIPTEFLPRFLNIHSDGYEYELDMLMITVREKRKIKAFPIKTIYENNNSSSHFNPILDSLKIYFVFLRFSSVSILTALLDYVVFSTLYILGNSVLGSFIGARLVAGAFNFKCNKHIVFRSQGKAWLEVIKFVLLVIAMMFVAYGLVQFMVNTLGMNIYVSKIIAEGGLFFASFAIQRVFIFKWHHI